MFREDLEDAFEYVGLLYINKRPYYPYDYGHGDWFPETAGAYAGNAIGLCTNYTDIELCEYEGRNPPLPNTARPEMVLFISYMETMLTCTLAQGGMGFSLSASDVYKSVNLTLGWDAMGQVNYWKNVKTSIVDSVEIGNGLLNEDIGRVVLYGDQVRNERFLEVLQDAIDELFPPGIEVLSRNHVFSPARGAAEMAKRVWWKYDHTVNM